MVSEPEPESQPQLVLKAPSDKRQYQAVHLRNGLSALLICDPEIKTAANHDAHHDACSSCDDDDDEDDDDEDDDEDDEEGDDEREEDSAAAEDERSGKKRNRMAQTKKAAAAMCVNVGSYSDPQDAEGLAHFLEHMLFMGSTKFPDENEYDGFLAEHGGSSNAFTEMEYTCYHFDVNHLYLKPALERFSQFFVSPLVKADSIEREIQAVNSEFVQVLQNDSCRLNQLKCNTAHPRHPFNRFAWGNEKSLMETINKCVDVRRKLLDFYRQHYFASRMKLVVLGGEPLETLKEWVHQLFEDIPEGSTKAPVYSWDGPVWPSGKLYRMESVKDQHLLDLSWVLPCLDAEYLKKPHDYLAHVIGHEGTGSLLRFLKLKGWATDLSAGVGEDGFERSSAGYLFNVSITLSQAGLEKIFDIISSFFEFVRMLRESKPQQWVFEELQAVSEVSFRFAEEDAADEYVVTLAKNMLIYPEKHVIYGDYAYEQWDPKLVDELLDHINPGMMRIDLLTKSFSRDAPEVEYEPWFGAPYTVTEVPDTLLTTWSNAKAGHSDFHVPEVNEFISRDFSLRQAVNASLLPTLAFEDSLCKVWYKLDQTFKTPRGNVYIAVTYKMDVLRSEVLSNLYVMLLKDALNETLYMASVAGLSSSMSSSPHKIELKLHGYNEKLHVLARKISALLKTLVVRPDRFQAMKEQLERTFRNAKVKPLTHSGSLRLQILKKQFWTAEEKLACLTTLSYEDVNDFIPQLFHQAHVEALCHGNMTKEEALDVVNIVKEALLAVPIAEGCMPKERMVKLPSKCDFTYNASVVNKQEENSVAEMYFQVGQDVGSESVREKALADLFEHIVYEPCFNQLRTIEQLGYRVECGSRYTYGIIGFCFRIMSSKYSPAYLHKRIDLFIDRLQGILKDMSDEAFQNYKECLIAEKMEKDNCLADETDHHWEHVLNQRYLFDAHEREAMALRNIEKKDVVEWYNKVMKAGGGMRRCVCIHLWGCKLVQEMKKNKKNKKQPYKLIDDIEEFKSKAELYPPFP